MFFDLTNLFIRDSPWRDVRAKLPINSFVHFLKHSKREYHFVKRIFVNIAAINNSSNLKCLNDNCSYEYLKFSTTGIKLFAWK